MSQFQISKLLVVLVLLYVYRLDRNSVDTDQQASSYASLSTPFLKEGIEF